MGQSFACTSGYLDPRIVSFVESQIHSTKILVVSKTTCTACTRAKQLLRGLVSKTGVNPSVFEVDKYELQCTKGIMKYISAQTGINTVPQIYINGRFVGGNQTVQRLHLERRLVPLILQPMKTSPSISSATHGKGFRYVASSPSTAPSIRVSAFKTDILPIPTFEKLRPSSSSSSSTTTSMLNDDMKSNDFSNYWSKVESSSGSRSRSSITSGDSWSPQSSSFIENSNFPQRRVSSIAYSAVENSHMSIYNDSKSSVISADLEILGKPARLASASSFSSPKAWSGARQALRMNSTQYISDEEILSKPAEPKRRSLGRPAKARSLHGYSFIENEWLSNSSNEFPVRTIVTPLRKSKVLKQPINRGISDWTYVSSRII